MCQTILSNPKAVAFYQKNFSDSIQILSGKGILDRHTTKTLEFNSRS
jgi:hypothetical protein